MIANVDALPQQNAAPQIPVDDGNFIVINRPNIPTVRALMPEAICSKSTFQ